MPLVTCKNGGAEVSVSREPVEQELRPADAHGPAVFVVLGNGWVVHRCEPRLGRDMPMDSR